MTDFRTFENLPGIVYDANDTRTIFAEDMNALGGAVNDLEDAVFSKPTVYARLSADLENNPQGDFVQVTFNQTVWNVGDYFDTVTEHGWIPPAGIYRYSILIRFLSSGTIFTQARLMKNGSVEQLGPSVQPPSGATTYVTLGGMFQANGTDVFTVEGRATTSGADFTITAGGPTNFAAEAI